MINATVSCHCRSSACTSVTHAASPLTHLAFPTSYTSCLLLKQLASVVYSNATTTQNVQDFIAADILASRLVFITTGGPIASTRGPGANFTAWMARYPLTGLVIIRMLKCACVVGWPLLQLMYHIFQCILFTMLAIIIMRLKLFWTPHLCLMTSLLASRQVC